MLAETRQNKLVEIVNERKSISVQELMKLLKVSEVTVRRDITALDKQGLLSKVHGGAISKQGIQESDSAIELRETLWSKEKEQIGKYAATLINDFDCIYLDAGSTTSFVIPHIKHKNISIVTNSIEHAKQLTQRNITCYLLGGVIKLSTGAIVGEDALEMLDKFNFSKGFFGTNGLSINNGLTTPDRREAEIKHKAIQKCQQAYVLFDASKCETTSAIRFGSIDDVTLISNKICKDYEHLDNYKVVTT